MKAQLAMLLAVVLSTGLWSGGLAAESGPNAPQNTVRILQVQVLDFAVYSGRRGELRVACIKSTECDKLVVSLDESTQLSVQGQQLTLEQAVNMRWNLALVALDSGYKAVGLVHVNAFD